MEFILPKSEGEILMISGFQSRESRLGLKRLLSPKITEVNNARRHGAK